MNTRLHRPALTLGLVLLAGFRAPTPDSNSLILPGGAAAAQGDGSSQVPATLVWPRQFVKGGDTIVMYQPQIESWPNHTQMTFRSAIAVTPQGGGQTHYGVVTITGDTAVDEDARTVYISIPNAQVNFPGLAPAQSQPLQQLVQSLMPPSGAVDVSLDQVLAYVHDTSKTPKVDVSLAPPPMFYSDVPAILVIYLGAPQFQPLTGTHLMFAVNTNWVVIMDPSSNQYFLLYGDSWLASPDPMKGPWTQATNLPMDLATMPSTGNWDSVKSHVPGTPFQVVPKVFTSAQPAELIVTNGPPDYTPLSGTRLMYVSNPVTPMFLDMIDFNYYYLVAGRWFRAPKPVGPWTAASADLPAEFAKIPPESPVGFVLSSIPHTQEADDAILLASIPHKATINVATATLQVAYQGEPKFAPIAGTSMTYAVNTAYQVVFAAGQYFCCYQGVWFQSQTPTGPWTACAQVPDVIYTIPPSSPMYNVTYVHVYSSTPTTVVVGYTAGYSGEYVAATGALMFGAGFWLGGAMASDYPWYGCPPCYYSYGCATSYSYGYGCYCRTGGAYYGPCGGAGWGAAYNPATGTYSRAGAAYGPGGAAWGAQAYNPMTNTYAQHAGATNGYRSWGSSYVQQGNKWVEAGHQSGALGSTGWVQNSSGQWAAGARGNEGNAVAATSSGNVYASHDGNVYKNTDGSWQKYQGGGNWSNESANRPAQTPASSGGASNWGQHDMQTSLNGDAWARSQGNANAFSSANDRTGGWGGQSGWGGGGGARFGGGGGWGRRR